MHSQKLQAGSPFPTITLQPLNGEAIELSPQHNSSDWTLLVIYRGQHCPLCTQYLNELQQHASTLSEAGVKVIALSADSKAQLKAHQQALHVNFPIAYGLTLEQMQALGLYISKPRSEEETDHYFAEPALFVINQDNQLQIVELANNPFIRPNLTLFVAGIQWLRDPNNNYPIRGTFQASQT